MLRTFKFSHSIQTVFTEPVTVYSHLLYRLSYASIRCSGSGTRTREAKAAAYETAQIPTSDIPLWKGRQDGTRTRVLGLIGFARRHHSGTLVFCFSEDSWRLQRRLRKVSEFTSYGLGFCLLLRCALQHLTMSDTVHQAEG